IDDAAQDDDDAEIEREEAGLRSLGAPSDADLYAAEDDDQPEQRRRERDADLDAALAETGALAVSFTHDCSCLRAPRRFRRRDGPAGETKRSLSCPRRGSPRPSSARDGAVLPCRPNSCIRRRT